MSRTIDTTDKPIDCFPRVSGDEPQSDHTDPGVNLFSPRERG